MEFTVHNYLRWRHQYSMFKWWKLWPIYTTQLLPKTVAFNLLTISVVLCKSSTQFTYVVVSELLACLSPGNSRRQLTRLVSCVLDLHSTTQVVKRFFCMSRNTRSKLMRLIYHLRLWLYSKFLFFDTFLNRQTNLKSMFSALSVK
jgi:hypothetical protein